MHVCKGSIQGRQVIKKNIILKENIQLKNQ